MIRIQMLTGPQSGLQTTHSEPRLTFGRAPGNSITVDDPHLSRLHGELVFENGQWSLINRSPNGTSVNRRTVTGDKPHPLKPGDVIAVGSTRLFNVQFTPAAAPVAAEAPVEAEPKKRMTRRAKVWTGIGIYIGAMLLFMVYISAGTKSKSVQQMPVVLTGEQIATIIREKPVVRDRSERDAQEALKRARAWYASRDSKPQGYYWAHREYKLARAHLREGLEPQDQLQFNHAEAELTRRVGQSYDTATKLSLSRDFAGAETAFIQLFAIYPDESSALAENIRAHRTYANANRPKKSMGFSR